MNVEFVAFAGRPWPTEQESDSLREVGRFASFTECQRAFSSVDFVSLPTLHGQSRWRGWAPQVGSIVQVERRVLSLV